MRHGNFELCESKAIATYLDRAFDGPPLFPAEPRELALAEQWISLVNTVIDQALIRQYLFAYVFPKTADGQPDRAVIETVTPTLRQHIALLDKAVAATGYLAGKQYSFADMNLMPILYYVRQSPEGGEAIAKANHLAGYYERHATRPAFKNTVPPPPPTRQAKPN
jgi:glutathione S-transferase